MAEFLVTPLGKWTGISIAVLVSIFAQSMMKIGTSQLGRFGDIALVPYILKLFLSPMILLSLAAYGLGAVFYMFMLSRLDLGFLYPVATALGIVLAMCVSIFFFHESISIMRLMGILVIIIGVFIVSQS